MDETKKLNIIVIDDGSAAGASAVAHSKVLAERFNASLTVVHDFHFRRKSYDKALKIRALQEKEVSVTRKDELVVRDGITQIMEPMMAAQVHALAEETNTALIVIGVTKRGERNLFSAARALQFIKPSRVPVLTVGEQFPNAESYQQVVLPLDIHRQSKEKALWAGYFNRFGGATVHVLHATYKDKFLKQQLHDNLNFVRKLYGNLDIVFQQHEAVVRGDIDQFSLRFAHDLGATLTVIMTTRYRSLVDLLFGVKEKSLICNELGLPVLCINERDDLYVLCT